jgi:hypothetical protein
VLLLTLVAGIFVYMYLLTMSVVHVVIRKETTQTVQALETEIASLETKFMLAQHVVSTAIVENQGFTQTSEKIFVSRPTDTAIALSRP